MFDITLLRSFVAVTDARSFTAGAATLGLSQPTVSQHVRRLEAVAGQKLLTRDTHAVELTPNGAVLLRYAREIVALDEQAGAHFAGATNEGRVRLGVSEDLALTKLADSLRPLFQGDSNMQIELTVGLAEMLRMKLDAGRLDLMIAKRQADDERGTVIRHEALAWVAHRDFELPKGRVPLVICPSASITGGLAVQALQRVGRPWRLACSSETLSGVWCGLRAGLGVSAQSRLMLDVPPCDLKEVDREAGLPLLGCVEFVLLVRSRRLSAPAQSVADLIVRTAAEI